MIWSLSLPLTFLYLLCDIDRKRHSASTIWVVKSIENIKHGAFLDFGYFALEESLAAL